MKLYKISLLMAFLMLFAANETKAQVFGKRPLMLVGVHQVANVAGNAEHNWFKDGMNAYEPNKKTIAKIGRQWNSDLQIVAFGGSWCPDTHREMPAFFRSLQDAGITDNDVDLYFLDRSFESGTEAEEKYNIRSVPTFVVLRNGKEIGRINESPGKPAEELLLQIISK